MSFDVSGGEGAGSSEIAGREASRDSPDEVRDPTETLQCARGTWTQAINEKWWRSVSPDGLWSGLEFMLTDERDEAYPRSGFRGVSGGSGSDQAPMNVFYRRVYETTSGTTSSSQLQDVLKDSTHFRVQTFPNEERFNKHVQFGVEKLAERFNKQSFNFVLENLAEALDSVDSPAPFLRHLKFYNSMGSERIVTPGLEVGVRILEAAKSGKLERLQSLMWIGCDLEDGWLESLADVIKAGHFSLLSCLYLSNNSFCSVRALAESLGRLPKLQILNLGENSKITEEGHKVLAKSMMVSEPLALETLAMDGCLMGDESCKAYGKALSSGRLKELKTLSFNKNNIGDKGAAALASAFQSGQAKCLSVIRLNDNIIGSDGLNLLASALVIHLRELTEFHLSHNNIGERGLVYLAGVLASGDLNFLKKLGILAGHSSEGGAKALLAALSSNKYLTLDLIFGWEAFPALDRQRKIAALQNRTHVDLLAQLGGNMVPATFGKVYLCGNPEVGKTTLKRSLQRGFWKSLGTWETRKRVEKRTRGIDVSHINSKNRQGKDEVSLIVWDMAGQNDYHLVHNAFLPDLVQGGGKATVFVVVCTSKSKEKASQELDYWLRFIASSCNQNIQIPRDVFVVLNRINGDEKILRNVKGWTQMLATKREKFQGFLEIKADPFVKDVRVRKHLQSLRQSLIDRSREMLGKHQVPEICQQIQMNLGLWSKRRPQFPVVSWDGFVREVGRTGALLSENDLQAAVKYLNEAGVLIYIDRVFPGEWHVLHKKLVVLDPNWFCKEITGNMFLPHEMRESEEEPLFR